MTPEERSAWEAQLDRWIDGQEALLLDMACRLMEIRSVRTAPQPGMPYGPGPDRKSTRLNSSHCASAGKRAFR
jgi:hypothetical protein